MPHYHVLSPLAAPMAYAAWLANGTALIVVLLVCADFARRQGRSWWLLLGLAFAVAPVSRTVVDLAHGVLPLPTGLVFPEHEITPAALVQVAPMETTARGFVQVTQVSIWWDGTLYLVALVLAWAWWRERQRLSPSAPASA
ncbi:MAG: hypothetical protein WDO13_12415 [Verrucomicrobiota bacterium]